MCSKRHSADTDFSAWYVACAQTHAPPTPTVARPQGVDHLTVVARCRASAQGGGCIDAFLATSACCSALSRATSAMRAAFLFSFGFGAEGGASGAGGGARPAFSASCSTLSAASCAASPTFLSDIAAAGGAAVARH